MLLSDLNFNIFDINFYVILFNMVYHLVCKLDVSSSNTEHGPMQGVVH